MNRSTQNQNNWLKVEQLVDNIFERQYYTNHGPELKLLENELEQIHSNQEVLGMANFDIAFLISLIALGTDNEVIIPSLVEESTFQALVFLKRKLKILPVNTINGIISLDEGNLMQNQSNSQDVLIVNNTFGSTPDRERLYAFAKKTNAAVVLLSKDGFGQPNNFDWPSDVLLLEIFDFSDRSSINGGIGAAVKSNNKLLAEKLRNIRSSYGAREKLSIPFTGNGRMSEFQAGLIRLALKDHIDFSSQQKSTWLKAVKSLEEIENITVIQNNLETTTPFYNRIVLNISNNSQIDINRLNQELSFLNGDIKTPTELGLIVLKNNQEAIDFIKNTIVLPIKRELTDDRINRIKSVVEKYI